MENQNTTNNGTDGANEAEKVDRAGKLGALLRTRFAGVKAQLDGKVKGAFQTALDKVKSGLDLPSKSEVSSLAQRIEDLDRKLADYETRATAAGKGKKKDASEQFA